MEISGMVKWKWNAGNETEVRKIYIFMFMGQKSCSPCVTGYKMLMKPWNGRRLKKRERWVHIPKILHLTHFTSLWKCHSWVILPIPSSHPEEDFDWQWCSNTIVVHMWAASLSRDIGQGGFSEVSVHWGLSWLHGADSVKFIPLIHTDSCSFLNTRGVT